MSIRDSLLFSIIYSGMSILTLKRDLKNKKNTFENRHPKKAMISMRNQTMTHEVAMLIPYAEGLGSW